MLEGSLRGVPQAWQGKMEANKAGWGNKAVRRVSLKVRAGATGLAGEQGDNSGARQGAGLGGTHGGHAFGLGRGCR